MEAPLTSSDRSAASEPEIGVDAFRHAMRELAGGVAVVTVGRDADITGFTATSVVSLCASPPRIFICVSRSSASWAALQKHPCFGINLLRQEDRAVADRFAGRDGLEGAERYRGAAWSPLRTGAPLLDTALAALDCEVEESLARYDHAIVIGRIIAMRVRADGPPLVYWQGDYHPFEQIVGARKAP
ncbi:MAG TPA: flavin reductase family protein [Stellaceae bacterium]|nr:flavin reductase family protein [Stellaceae bacterium]